MPDPDPAGRRDGRVRGEGSGRGKERKAVFFKGIPDPGRVSCAGIGAPSHLYQKRCR